VTFRSVGAGVSGTGTSASVPVPAGVAVDDIITVGMYIENGTDAGAAFTATGFDGFLCDTGVTNGATRGRLMVWWRRATAADAGTYSISWTTSSAYEAVAMAHSGIRTTGDPRGGENAIISSSSTSLTANVGTFTPSNGLSDLVGWSTNHATNAGAYSPPTGFTERYDNSGSAIAHLDAASQDSFVRAATGTRTFTSTGVAGFSYPRGYIAALIRESYLTAAGSIPQPTLAVDLDVATATNNLTVAGSIPQPTLAVSLSGFNDSDLTAAGTIPQPVLAVSLAGFNDSDLTSAGSIPQPVLAVSLYVAPTSTTADIAGTIPQPVIAASLYVTPIIHAVDIAGTMPQPTLVVALSVEDIPQVVVDTPDERTLIVGAETRSLAVAADDRTLVVTEDPRALAVATENRTLGVTQ
jgi:hypothetical protein